MFEAFEEVTAGICATVGDSADHVFTGAMLKDPRDVCVGGQTYWYHCYDERGPSYGFEYCRGVYNSGAGSITREPIRTSEADDSLVDWPAASQLVVAVCASKEMQTQFISTFAGLEPQHGVLVGGLGQSNNSFVNAMDNDTLVQVDGVRDWSSDGVSQANIDWRVPDPDDVYADTTFPYVGYHRSRDFQGTVGVQDGVHQTAMLSMEFCKTLSIFTGRTVWHVGMSFPGASVTYWDYHGGPTSGGNIFDTQIKAAIAAIPADQGITYPHFMLVAQGVADMIGGMSEGEWVTRWIDFIYDAEQDDRWGWAEKDKTRWMFTQPPPSVDEKYRFNGHSILGEMTAENVQIITSKGIDTYDGTHWTGESVLEIAYRCYHASAVSQTFQTPLNSARVRPELKTAYEALSKINQWADGGQTDSAPAQYTFNRNLANDKFRLHKTPSVNGIIPGDATGVGFERLGRDGFPHTITFGDNGNFYVVYLQGLPEDMGDYWEFTLEAIGSSGTPSGNMPCEPGRLLFDGQTLIQEASLPRVSPLLAQGSTHTSREAIGAAEYIFKQYPLLVDSAGGTYRSTGWAVDQPARVTTTDATTTNLRALFLNETETHQIFRVAVAAKSTTVSGDPLFYAEYRGAIYIEAGGNSVLRGTVDETVITSATGLSASVYAYNVGFGHGLGVDVTGAAAETWDWTCQLEMLRLV